MPDSEKVMSWLEGLAEPDWRECYSDSEVQETARQALDLIDELLKEQEAVAPEKEHSGSGITWWNVCGNCKTAINPNDKYCHECGRAVKWE